MLAKLQRTAAGSQGDLLLPHVTGRHVRLEEVKLEVPVDRNPQEPLADRGEDGGLHHQIGIQVVQLHLVVVEDRPDQTTGCDVNPLGFSPDLSIRGAG